MSDCSAFCDHLQVMLNLFYLKLRRLMISCLPLRLVDEYVALAVCLLNRVPVPLLHYIFFMDCLGIKSSEKPETNRPDYGTINLFCCIHGPVGHRSVTSCVFVAFLMITTGAIPFPRYYSISYVSRKCVCIRLVD